MQKQGRRCKPSCAYPAPPMRLGTQILLLAAVFAAGTGIAELAGAANLGTAMAFGQIGFVAALVGLLARA
jgi:hypothetical protein